MRFALQQPTRSTAVSGRRATRLPLDVLNLEDAEGAPASTQGQRAALRADGAALRNPAYAS